MKLIDKVVTRKEDLKQPKGSLVLETITQDAHILGGAIQMPVTRPEMDWYNLEITPEIQRVLDGDLYNCTNNSLTNAWEFLLLNQTGKEVNFSEMYSAVDSGTVAGRGNSFERVFEKARVNFVSWEDEFPTMRDKTVAENYRKISDGLRSGVKKRGKDYLKRYQFLGSQQDAYAYQEALKISPVTVAVEGRYHWKNGVIVNNGGAYNHAVLYLGMKDGKKIVFDSENKQVIPFHKDYKFQFPCVHSIKRINMIGKNIYKKKGESALYGKLRDKDLLIPFIANDKIFKEKKVGIGDIFKALFNSDDYLKEERINVNELPYPIAKFGISLVPLEDLGTGLEVVESETLWEVLVKWFKNRK